MDLSYRLYQDFMVDRTEMILSASVLDNVAQQISEKTSQYSLDCEIRCFEDRFLDESLDKIREAIRKNSENSSGDKELLVTLEITAGRKDFLLRFFNKEVKGISDPMKWKFEKFRDGLKALLDPSDFVDRIEVNVNKLPPLD